MPDKRVAFVRLDINDRALFYDAHELELSSDDAVMVEHDVGMESGRIVIPPVVVDVPDGGLPRVIRKATSDDLKRINAAREKEAEAFEFCKERIKERELPMKLLKVEAWLDGSKILFYFWAENRVDFRELVKDLARKFRTRIELRQIGVRDAAKILGGIGPCGRMTCCSSWIRQFESISIKMAKDQSLALNPSKVSGICGRLLCCLGYEFGQYEDALKWLPPIGRRVSTSRGEGRIVRVNAYLQKVYVVIDGEAQESEFSPGDVQVMEAPRGESEQDVVEEEAELEKLGEENEKETEQGTGDE